MNKSMVVLKMQRNDDGFELTAFFQRHNSKENGGIFSQIRASTFW